MSPLKRQAHGFPTDPLGKVGAGLCTWSAPEKEGRRLEAATRGAGAQGVMSQPGEGQGGSRRPAAGPGVSGPTPLPSRASPVPTGRPLPHSALPSPAPPSPAPAERLADLRSKASATAIEWLPGRYLVRHGDGGFPRGLRTAAASGRQNLAPGFTNPSLFPTAQHRGWRDFRYAWRHFRYALRGRRRKRGKARRENQWGGCPEAGGPSGFSGGRASEYTTVPSAAPRLGLVPGSQAHPPGEKFRVPSLDVWKRTDSTDPSLRYLARF